MAKSQAKFDEKCHLGIDVDDQSPLKSRPSSVPKEQMKIIALNDDCLEKIFNHLELQSLFNVAIANEYLRPAAQQVYKQNFGACHVNIKPKKSIGLSFSPLNESDDTIEVNGLKTCFLFLRCFGQLIKCLKVGYGLNKDVVYEHVNQYISSYCAENLVRFEFNRTPNSFNGLFCKPFVNVEYVSICYGSLEKEFQSFSKWFPNARHLKLDQSEINLKFCGVHFQNLDHLDINLGYDYPDLLKSSASRLLNANRQLRSLVISVEIQQRGDEILTTLLNIIQKNSLITNLTVRTGNTNPLAKRSQIQRFAYEHRNLIELDLDCCKFTANDAFWLIHRLHALQKFHFFIYDPSEYQKLESKVNKSGKWLSSLDQSGEMVTLIRKK